uniref:Major facilitator superfamily (MFS) profile domain-containing protein n=1 Tax=Alexandrium monilatum TaxID=311494 RepID=A0A7S4UE53_9DINO
MTPEEPPPRCVFLMLLICMGAGWFGGIFTASMALQMLSLAESRPEEVILMPFLLRHFSPEVLAGGVMVVASVAGGGIGSLWNLFAADRIGLKVSCAAAFATLGFASMLAAYPPTYLMGVLASSVGGNVLAPILPALLSCQFDDDGRTQRYVTYAYASSNGAFVLATAVAGVQSFWMGYVESAVVACVSLALLRAAWGQLRDSSDKAKSPSAHPALRSNDLRIVGFAILCVLGLTFRAVFAQFLGGSFMVFAREEVSALGGLRVPPQWFLTLNGLIDMILAAPVAGLYECKPALRFHLKLRLGFALIAFGFGILGFAAKLTSMAGVSPLVVAAATLLISLGELHFNPVMMATIPSEMPANMLGRFNGIYFVVSGVGDTAQGLGVSLYEAAGAEGFFMVLAALAMTGFIGLQLVAPGLDYCFSEAAGAERLPLAVKGPAAPNP